MASASSQSPARWAASALAICSCVSGGTAIRPPWCPSSSRATCPYVPPRAASSSMDACSRHRASTVIAVWEPLRQQLLGNVAHVGPGVGRLDQVDAVEQLAAPEPVGLEQERERLALQPAGVGLDALTGTGPELLDVGRHDLAVAGELARPGCAT